MRRLLVPAAALVASAVLVAGCGSDSGSAEPALPPAPVGAERGQLVSQQSFDDIAPDVTQLGGTAVRVTYRSTSGVDGSGTEVSGAVFAPATPPPPGGYPVVAVGHGTTGVTDDCAPSASPDLRGNAALVASMLARGWVVAVSDYQGLGTPGPHPYLEPRSAAYDLIDSVRAARNVFPAASTTWAAYGESQGGQASWAAAEASSDYGDGLDFVGSAALSPAADVSGIFDVDAGGSAANVPLLSWPQKALLPYVLEGLRTVHPELDTSDYVRGPLADEPDVALSCITDRGGDKLRIATTMQPDDVGPSTPEAAERMHGWLDDLALPQGTAGGPLYVVAGGRDQLVRAEWTSSAVARACAQGDTIEFTVRPEQGHSEPAAVPGALDWIAARFVGGPAPDTCAAAGGR
ncbi:lipase family protein [Rhodococcus sp. HNM0569]|uniref:lipase family protein n=1 Tax=Rhodococcus sp. HNM0569 TaxID=2716340 RepID=UPI003211F5CF